MRKEGFMFCCDKCGRAEFVEDAGAVAPIGWEAVKYQTKVYHFCLDCLPRLHRVFEWLGFDVNE